MTTPTNATIAQLIPIYIQARRAERYSERTLESYEYVLRTFTAFLGNDPEISAIEGSTIRSFFASRTDISRKTAVNYQTALSSLWEWSILNHYCQENVARSAVKIRKPQQKEIIPFTRGDLVNLLEAAKVWNSPERDTALLFLLLDTGVRASELCGITLNDVYWENRKIRVRGKGDKERSLCFSDATYQALTLYLTKVRGVSIKRPTSVPLFLNRANTPYHRNSLRKVLERLGRHAEVINVHAHRFRHTFAIQFIRNGGNIYTLQKLLGHTTLEMCKRYLAIAQVDMDRDLQRASPVKGWALEIIQPPTTAAPETGGGGDMDDRA